MNSYKIPRIIHQFWDGDKPPLALTEFYAQSCRDLHPDWIYKLWTLDEIAELPDIDVDILAHLNKYYLKCNVKDYSMLQVLREYGGIFLDMDYICVRPFDEIAQRYRYFSSLEPPFIWQKIPATSFSLIGSEANGTFVNEIIEKFELYTKDIDYAVFINTEYSPDKTEGPHSTFVQFLIGLTIYDNCKDD